MTTTPAPPRGIGTEQRDRLLTKFVDFLTRQGLLSETKQEEWTVFALRSEAKTPFDVLVLLEDAEAFEETMGHQVLLHRWDAELLEGGITQIGLNSDDEDTQPADLRFLRGLDSSCPEQIGPYDIHSRLGEGGFGAVYLGKHKNLGRFDAIKVVGKMEDRDVLERTLREAQAGANVVHPNLCRVFTIDFSNSPPYIAMELIDGKSFNEYMDALPKDAIPLKVRIIIGICRALGALHELGLVHRDVKPANVIIDRNGRPVLVDFGLVKHQDGKDIRDASSRHELSTYSEEELEKAESEKEPSSNVTRVGTVIGTPQYMSPEQAHEQMTVTPAADVYSLGKMIYRAFTGEDLHPTDGTLLKLMSFLVKKGHVEEALEQVFLNCIPPRYDPIRFASILSHALMLDAADRIQTGAELEKQLTSYLEEIEKSEEQKLKEQERALTVSRRRSGILFFLLFSLLFVMAGVYVYSSRLLSAEKKAREAEKRERLALAKAVEEETKAAEQAHARAIEQEIAREKEEETRRKVEQLLSQVRVQHQTATGLNAARAAMREARWSDARREFDLILKSDPDSVDIREPLAQVLFNLRNSSCIEQYRWLAAQKKPEKMGEKCWIEHAHEYQLMAMIAVMECTSWSLQKQLTALRDLSRYFSKPSIHKKIADILVDAVCIRYSAQTKTPYQGLAAGLKRKVLDLFESDYDSAVVNYVVAVQLEPHFNNRNRTLDLLGSAYAKNPDFLPSLMARQRNSRWVVDELGLLHVRAPILIRSAQDDLVLLRERLPGRVEIDMAYVQCLVYKSRLRNYKHEQERLVQKAYKIAAGYAKNRRTPDYARNVRLVELSVALAFAAKYERAKAQNLGEKIQRDLWAESKVALTIALSQSMTPQEEEDLKLQQHFHKKTALVRELLR